MKLECDYCWELYDPWPFKIIEWDIWDMNIFNACPKCQKQIDNKKPND